MGDTIGTWTIQYSAQTVVKRPAGEPVDILTGSHLEWAAGYVHLVNRVLTAYNSPGVTDIPESDLARAFGVSRKIMLSRSDTLADAHQADFLRAREALARLIGNQTPTVARVLDAIANAPMSSGWPWPGDSYSDGEFLAGPSPETMALASVANLLLSKDDERNEDPYALQDPAMLFKSVLALDPDQLEAYKMLAVVLDLQGRCAEANRYIDVAFNRCIARITMPDGRWPERISSAHDGNTPILRALAWKARHLWRRRQSDEALDLLRRVLRLDPLGDFMVACHILGLRLKMRYWTFMDLIETDRDLALLTDWFDANYTRFPEEFDDWMASVAEARARLTDRRPGHSSATRPYTERPETVN